MDENFCYIHFYQAKILFITIDEEKKKNKKKKK